MKNIFLVGVLIVLIGAAVPASAGNRDVVIGNFPVYSEWSAIQSEVDWWFSPNLDLVGYHRVPYAAPPVLHQAFHMPVDYDYPPWPYIDAIPAHHPAASYKCIQPDFEGTVAGGTADCLYLNIYRPNANYTPWPQGHYTDSLPVVIWIHGGSMVTGHGLQLPKMLKELARRGMVVVSINYRLGIVGYATKVNRQDGMNGLIDADGLIGTAGNYGLWDQQKAIRWVHENIHRFGGDKNQISLMGESAGGYSVAAQVATNTNTLEFQSVVMQSSLVFSQPLDGGVMDIHADALEAATYPDFEATKPAMDNPCPTTDPNPLLCWRFLSAYQPELFAKWMVRATQAIEERSVFPHRNFYGVHHDVDGAFFRRPFWQEFQSYFDVPFLSFMNEHEAGLGSFLAQQHWSEYWASHDPTHLYGPDDVGLILTVPKSTFDAHLNTAASHYFADIAAVTSLEEAAVVAARILSDVALCTGHNALPVVVEGQGQSLVRRVRLDDVPDFMPWAWSGASALSPLTLQAVTEYANHVYELLFLDKFFLLSPVEKHLGARMVDTWAGFMTDPTVLVGYFYDGTGAVTVFEDPSDIHAPPGIGAVRGDYFGSGSAYAACAALTAAGMVDPADDYVGMTDTEPGVLGYD